MGFWQKWLRRIYWLVFYPQTVCAVKTVSPRITASYTSVVSSVPFSHIYKHAARAKLCRLGPQVCVILSDSCRCQATGCQVDELHGASCGMLITWKHSGGRGSARRTSLCAETVRMLIVSPPSPRLLQTQSLSKRRRSSWPWYVCELSVWIREVICMCVQRCLWRTENTKGHCVEVKSPLFCVYPFATWLYCAVCAGHECFF